MSWKAEVIADSSGKWYSNQLRFADREEASNYGAFLACQWTSVTALRATESDEPVNASFLGELKLLGVFNGLDVEP